MSGLKILILLTFFDRPELVKGFLRSLVRANTFYENWELVFIDDGSTKKGRPVAERVLGNLVSKTKFYDTGMDPENKRVCEGSFTGYYMNRAMRDSKADLVIFLGDDDEILPDYLFNLNSFFTKNPEVLSVYSDTYVFDPTHERPKYTIVHYRDIPDWKGHEWFGQPLECSGKVDGIQVCFRRECYSVHGAAFKFPIKIDHDARFFEELYERTGKSMYSGFVGTLKGRHSNQLIKRDEMATGVVDKKRGRVIL